MTSFRQKLAELALSEMTDGQLAEVLFGWMMTGYAAQHEDGADPEPPEEEQQEERHENAGDLFALQDYLNRVIKDEMGSDKLIDSPRELASIWQKAGEDMTRIKDAMTVVVDHHKTQATVNNPAAFLTVVLTRNDPATLSKQAAAIRAKADAGDSIVGSVTERSQQLAAQYRNQRSGKVINLAERLKKMQEAQAQKA